MWDLIVSVPDHCLSFYFFFFFFSRSEKKKKVQTNDKQWLGMIEVLFTWPL